MKIILSHSYIDFDCLAAMYGAYKLYPDGQMVVPGSMANNVKEFIRLHKDLIPFVLPSELDLPKIKKVVLVDTQQISRTGELYPFLKTRGDITYHIYDHHPVSEKREVRGKREVIRSCGAATTLVLAELRKKKIELTSIEATLLALGIYEDTGNLTFSTTTAEDAEAAAYLIRQGADLSVVNRFANFALSDDQHALLNHLFSVADFYTIGGLRCMLCVGQWSTPVDGLALITHKLMEMENCDIAFSIVTMRDKTFLVGRSRLPEVKVNEILRPFGGGGHTGAAAAWSTRKDIENIAQDIKKRIEDQIPKEVTAQDIMSFPVRTAVPEISVEAARELMLRYGHNALTIAKGGRVRGLLTRRDADKAIQLGFAREPVQKFMSRSLHVITKDTPFYQIHRAMVEKDIGRLLVMDGKVLAGIITRTDLLRLLYHKDIREKGHPKKIVNLRKTFSDDQRRMISRLGELAEKLNMRVYLVGGCVRDLILGFPNPDIDLVVEGDATLLASTFKKKYKEVTVKTYPEFGTATLHFLNGDRFDLATARTEYYAHPGAKPEVEHSSLKQDLYRRDFTINALALEVDPEHRGEVIDFFGGLQDMESRVLRILNNLSFIEDPIRILRAVRFEVKLGFQMEPLTFDFAKNALETGKFDSFSGDRLKQELKYGLSGPSAGLYVSKLIETGAIRLVDPRLLKKREILLQRIGKISETLQWYHRLARTTEVEEWMVYLYGFLGNVIMNERDKVAENLRLARSEKGIIKRGFDSQKEVLTRLETPQKRSQRYFALRDFPAETLLFWMAEAGPKVRKQLREYIETDRFVKIGISGDDLIKLGLKPGPAFNDILRRVLEAKLDKGLASKTQELALVKKIMHKDK